MTLASQALFHRIRRNSLPVPHKNALKEGPVFSRVPANALPDGVPGFGIKKFYETKDRSTASELEADYYQCFMKIDDHPAGFITTLDNKRTAMNKALKDQVEAANRDKVRLEAEKAALAEKLKLYEGGLL